MLIAEARTFTLGLFTVHQRIRHDNPYWPQYVIYRGEALIGKSFSVPDLGCCFWLERRGLDRLIYKTQQYSGAGTARIRGLDKARLVSLQRRKARLEAAQA